MVQVRIKNKFPEIIISKISKANYAFHEKYHGTGKVDFLFFNSFLLLLPKPLF